MRQQNLVARNNHTTTIFTWTMALCVLVGMMTISHNLAAAQSDRKNILVLGDSLSAAYGIQTDKGWVALLQHEVRDDYQIINASISGETTDGGLRALPGLLEKHAPDIVVIELGANDGLRGFPIPTIKRNLSELIKQSQQSGAKVLLVGMRIPPNYGAPYAEAFHKLFATLANEHATGLVPFLLNDIAIHSELMQSDRLHPTAEAQPKMKSYVLEGLKSLTDF